MAGLIDYRLQFSNLDESIKKLTQVDKLLTNLQRRGSGAGSMSVPNVPSAGAYSNVATISTVAINAQLALLTSKIAALNKAVSFTQRYQSIPNIPASQVGISKPPYLVSRGGALGGESFGGQVSNLNATRLMAMQLGKKAGWETGYPFGSLSGGLKLVNAIKTPAGTPFNLFNKFNKFAKENISVPLGPESTGEGSAQTHGFYSAASFSTSKSRKIMSDLETHYKKRLEFLMLKMQSLAHSEVLIGQGTIPPGVIENIKQNVRESVIPTLRMGYGKSKSEKWYADTERKLINEKISEMKSKMLEAMAVQNKIRMLQAGHMPGGHMLETSTGAGLGLGATPPLFSLGGISRMGLEMRHSYRMLSKHMSNMFKGMPHGGLPHTLMHHLGKAGLGKEGGMLLGVVSKFGLLGAAIGAIIVSLLSMREAIKETAELYRQSAREGQSIRDQAQVNHAFGAIGMKTPDLTKFYQSGYSGDANSFINAARTGMFGQEGQQLINMSEEFKSAMKDAEHAAKQMEKSAWASEKISREGSAIGMEWKALWAEIVEGASPLIVALEEITYWVLRLGADLAELINYLNPMLTLLSHIPTFKWLPLGHGNLEHTSFEKLGFVMGGPRPDKHLEDISFNTLNIWKKLDAILKIMAMSQSGNIGGAQLVAMGARSAMPNLP